MLVTQVILTILTLGYSAVPATFDFNSTHATNPHWTGHARFHVIWQVTAFCLIALMMLACIWTPILPGNLGLILPVCAAVAMYGGFFVAVFTRHIYGGKIYDRVGGVQPFFIKGIQFDVNLSLFTPLAILTVVAAVLVLRIVHAA